MLGPRGSSLLLALSIVNVRNDELWSCSVIMMCTFRRGSTIHCSTIRSPFFFWWLCKGMCSCSPNAISCCSMQMQARMSLLKCCEDVLGILVMMKRRVGLPLSEGRKAIRGFSGVKTLKFDGRC